MAAPILVLAALAWTHRSMFVDGFIYLHVVQNILAGHGPVFNQGQRVEAFTSPLWTFLLAVVGFLTPFPLDWIAVVLGILLTIGGASIALRTSARLVHRAAPQTFLLPLGLVVFVAVPPVWSLASMGLETGLTFFWLGCCFAFLVRWSRAAHQRMPRFGLVVLGLGPLVRPELASTAWSSSWLCSGWSDQNNPGDNESVPLPGQRRYHSATRYFAWVTTGSW